MASILKYDPDKHQHSRNYLFFMIALVALILMPGFIGEILPDHIITGRRISAIFYVITILAGVYTVTNDLRQLGTGLVLGILTLVLAVLRMERTFEANWFYTLSFLVSGSFFLFLFIHCIKDIIKNKEVDLMTIYAAICGYLLLGIGGMVFFNYINHVFPGAYSVAIPHDDFFPMLYFSFVTLTTLGYGDICPVHPIPRSLAVFFSVTGQLYLTVLIAMLVGKYISRSARNRE